MIDIVDPAKRSQMMAGIRTTNTKPERRVRSLLHARGIRFARKNYGLPGRPDLVLPKWKVAIFVNGCFWHMHNCQLFRMPQSNREFWEKKLSGNYVRDLRNIADAMAMGWKVLTIWECALRRSEALETLDKNMDGVVDWIRATKVKSYCDLSDTGVTFRENIYESN